MRSAGQRVGDQIVDPHAEALRQAQVNRHRRLPLTVLRLREAGLRNPHRLGQFKADRKSAAALALTVWITYRSADRVARMMGPTGSRSVTRLAAFLLLCVGVQIPIAGVEDVLAPLLAQR